MLNIKMTMPGTPLGFPIWYFYISWSDLRCSEKLRLQPVFRETLGQGNTSMNIDDHENHNAPGEKAEIESI